MHADAIDPERRTRLSLLVVGGAEGREQVEQALRGFLPGLEIRQVSGIAAAAALLGRFPFDAVLADHEVEDGTSLDLLEALQAQDVRVPVVVQGRAGEEADAVAVLKAGARDYLRRDMNDPYLRTLPAALLGAIHRHHLEQQREARACREEQRRLLEAIHAAVAKVNHEISNPLAIISGNAQLLMELVQVLGLREELGQPIADIEEATQRLAASLRKLHDLKESLSLA